MRASPILATAFAGLLLGACQTASVATPPAPPPEKAYPGVTPSTFHMPTGAGCSGEIARFQAVLDNDVAIGHTTKGVHDRATADLDRARATCSAGNEAAALGQLHAVKARFGYPG
ncbi:MAG: hypothetical protein ACTHP8_04955 [Bosea sp. (in: a-proteobacteria)]|uniref:hypothetical protein n=1 Tax=Bosea sp. (in: a-proteobacteria) TaxID=1871050 RepID=UPI003F7C7959